MGAPAGWYCGTCHNGPMSIGLDHYCVNCGRARDSYSSHSPFPFRGQRSQASSALFGLARRSKLTADLGRSAGKIDISSAQPTSEGASPKSGAPINSRHNVTPEERSTSFSINAPKSSEFVYKFDEEDGLENATALHTQSLLSKKAEKSSKTPKEHSPAKISKHAHGPSEPELPLEMPVDEAQNYQEPDKSTITGDEISIFEDTHEQWTSDDTSKDISGDTGVSDDVEPKGVHGPPSDPERDRNSLRGPLVEPRTSDRSSDDPDTSEQTRRKLNRGPLLPPVIDMLLVRACGIVTRLFEPSPLPGRTRIRWRCQCGQMLYDDFIELRPGALADLEKSLNSTGGFYECNPSSSNATSYASNRLDRRSAGGWLGPFQWPWKTANAQSPSLPLHERQDALDRTSTQLPANNERRGLCIFLCIPYRKTANKLYPWVVEKVSTDNALFSSLRSLHKTAREEHISTFSLKTIKSIRFVRFEVYSQGLVDVRTTPDMPDASRRDEYSYRPMPAEFIPPIGENHMMHLYTYPDQAEHTGICLGKIPKKIEGLGWLPTHAQGSKVGWGLHFVEGLDVTKLWVCGFIGFMTSIMFGIAWSMIEDDIQSGFAVAACMLTGLLFTTGMVQAAYEPK